MIADVLKALNLHDEERAKRAKRAQAGIHARVGALRTIGKRIDALLDFPGGNLLPFEDLASRLLLVNKLLEAGCEAAKDASSSTFNGYYNEITTPALEETEKKFPRPTEKKSGGLSEEDLRSLGLAV